MKTYKIEKERQLLILRKKAPRKDITKRKMFFLQHLQVNNKIVFINKWTLPLPCLQPWSAEPWQSLVVATMAGVILKYSTNSLHQLKGRKWHLRYFCVGCSHLYLELKKKSFLFHVRSMWLYVDFRYTISCKNAWWKVTGLNMWWDKSRLNDKKRESSK